MLSEEEYSDPILASLGSLSDQIKDDLDFQDVNSKSEVHHEEVCGWAISHCDLNRFRWNHQRKVLRIPSKEPKNSTGLRSFSRQSYRNDIEFEFKHYQHRTSYVEQYRNAKMNIHDLSEVVSKSGNERRKSLECEQCTTTRNTRERGSKRMDSEKLIDRSRSPNLMATESSRMLGEFQRKKLYSRPTSSFRNAAHGNRETTRIEGSDNSVTSHDQRPLDRQLYHGMQESWTIIGVEKRPLPLQKRKPDIYSSLSANSHRRGKTGRRSKQNCTTLNKCDTWVRNREQNLRGPYGSDCFKVAPRSSSAPNVYDTTRSKQPTWHSRGECKTFHPVEGQERSSQKQHGTSSKTDYSRYTEMFKNVLEYYGTKKLQPKPKLSTNTENGRLLSVET